MPVFPLDWIEGGNEAHQTTPMMPCAFRMKAHTDTHRYYAMPSASCFGRIYRIHNRAIPCLDSTAKLSFSVPFWTPWKAFARRVLLLWETIAVPLMINNSSLSYEMWSLHIVFHNSAQADGQRTNISMLLVLEFHSDEGAPCQSVWYEPLIVRIRDPQY